MKLHGLNIRLAERFYTSLQALEVVLRNRIHTVLAEIKGQTWYKDHVGVWLVSDQREQLAGVIE